MTDPIARVVHEVEISPMRTQRHDVLKLEGEFVPLTNRLRGPNGRRVLISQVDGTVRSQTFAPSEQVTIRLELPEGKCPRCHLFERFAGKL